MKCEKILKSVQKFRNFGKPIEMSYTHNRKSVFGSVLTTIDYNIEKDSSKRKHEWFKSATRESVLSKRFKSDNSLENNNTLNINDYEKCCKRDHISKFSAEEKCEILNYFNSIKTNDQKNEYLKSFVIPVDVLNRRVSNSGRTQSIEYYIKTRDRDNPNIQKETQICRQAFLKLHQIKESRLRNKILKNREQTKDMRGIHESRYNTIPLEVENDVREFLANYPSQESHYSSTVKTGRKYLGADKTIASIHREFLSEYVEYDNYVSYGFFRFIFKDCNVGFGYPRADVCCNCEEMNVEIERFKKSENLENFEAIKLKLDEHQNEANYFYTLKNNLKSIENKNNKIAIICVDFQKNFYLPITKVSIEYYSRQLSLHNFCVHDMKTSKSLMFMYTENFALKGPNETISFINFYIKNKIEATVEEIYIFSDNNFAQNKSRFLWLFYKSLVIDNLFTKITIIYPIPGHSYLEADMDFALIEKKRRKVNKISLPQEYVQMVESANLKNPFQVIYANYPLSKDLSEDNHEIVKILDYKSLLNDYLKPNLEHLTGVRIIEFKNSSTKISLDLRQKPNIELNLLKTNSNISGITQKYFNLNPAYNDFLPIKQEKYEDVKKLLNYVLLPENTTFYCDRYLKIKNKSDFNSLNYTEKDLEHCVCKGKCIKKCICKLSSKACTDLCLCNPKYCQNKINNRE